MEICFIGSKINMGGSTTQFNNDVKELKDKRSITVFHDKGGKFDLSVIEKFDAIFCTSIDIANRISENKKLMKKTLLFINGRQDYTFDPGNFKENRKLALFILPILKKIIKISDKRLYRLRMLLSKYFTGIDPIILDTLLKFDYVYVPSNFWGNILKKYYGVKYRKIPYGLDKKYWKEIHYKTGKKPVKIMISTGYLKFKQLDSGLDKINKVLEEFKGDVICDFIWYANHYLNLMDKYRKKYPNINFRKGSKDPRKLFSSYDLLLHPSLGDTFCMVVLECLALGIPTVASTISEDISGNHLIHISPKNKEYSKTIRKVILDKSLRERLSKKGIKFAKSWMTWNQRADLILKELKKRSKNEKRL